VDGRVRDRQRRKSRSVGGEELVVAGDFETLLGDVQHGVASTTNLIIALLASGCGARNATAC
jgi:hypothetical protein